MSQVCSPSEMIAAVQRGDLTVLEDMTACYGNRLLAEGRRRCRTPEEAEDAVQDALLSAGENLLSFRGDGSLEGWLVRMVANACHRLQRGRKNDHSLHVVEEDLAEKMLDPERGAEVSELYSVLGEVLGELSPTDRLVFILAEGQDYKGPEIASELGLTPQAVRSRLTRSRRRVRERMSEKLEG